MIQSVFARSEAIQRDLRITFDLKYLLHSLTIMEQQHNLHKKAAVEHVDYKDITSLGNYINPHARMNSRRRTGFTAKQQRDFARAIKRARFMAFMPYISH